jgi:predicted esterase
MKNTMIFIHGKGTTPDDQKYNPFRELAKRMNADFISIIAPNLHSKGFRWHNGNKQSPDEAAAEFAKSVAHLESETSRIIAERAISYDDIIWVGHSQGGDMAIRMALIHGAKQVIVFGADISGKFPIPKTINKNFVIDWIEAGNDDVLNEERRSSYKILQHMGIRINYLKNQNSTHNDWDLTPYYNFSGLNNLSIQNNQR